MARHPFLSVQTLRGNFGNELYFLDPFALESWLEFLKGEPDFADAARDRRWKVGVFKNSLNHFPLATKNLARQFCEVEPLQPKQDETWMVDEVLSLVFRGETTQRARAELLVLARRRRQGQKLLLLSNCQRLSSLPNAQTFFFGDIEESGDLPIDFNLFLDMKLHPRLRQIAEESLQTGHYPQAVQGAIIALCKRLGEALPSTQAEGLAQMDEAFACDQAKRNPQNQKRPRVALNALSCDSDWNEALGYWKLFAGAPTALRNPAAHEEPDGAWIQERFGDKLTTAKVLCFLSLLFEKLDARHTP